METPPEQPSITELIDALLNSDQPLPVRLISCLSDISLEDLSTLAQIWPQLPERRRRTLMEDIEVIGENNYALSFENIASFCTQDNDPTVRELAVRILMEYDSKKNLDILLKLLENDESTSVRAATATALGKYVYSGELDHLDTATRHVLEEVLLQACQASEPTLVRRRALESLGYSSNQSVAQLITDAYNSGKEDWICSALCAMGCSADDAWHDHVLPKLSDDSPNIRAEAVRAAGELEIKTALSEIILLLNDDHDDVRLAAIWSLSQIGGLGAREALEALFEATEDEEEAELIDEALDNLAFTEDTQTFSLLDVEPDDQGL